MKMTFVLCAGPQARLEIRPARSPLGTRRDLVSGSKMLHLLIFNENRLQSKFSEEYLRRYPGATPPDYLDGTLPGDR